MGSYRGAGQRVASVTNREAPSRLDLSIPAVKERKISRPARSETYSIIITHTPPPFQSTVITDLRLSL